MTTRPPDAGRVYFLRITPLNWVLALWYSRQAQVCYWRSALPARLLSRFTRVAVESEISRDEWLSITDDAFDVWRERIHPALDASASLIARYRGTRIDFRVVLVQHYGQEFERVFQFCRVLELTHGDGAQLIEPWFARVVTRRTMAEIAGRCAIVASPSNRVLEALYEWTFAVGHLMRLGKLATRRLTARGLTVKPGAVLWGGISPQEMPAQDDRLDFAWPSRFAGVPASDVVYLLPLAASPEQQRFFERDGRIALAPTELGRLVSAGAALRAFLAAASAALRALLFERTAAASYRALFAARAFLWIDIAEALKPLGYVTTTSQCWPERPEVAALAAKGVAARIWAYSANSLVFARDTPFRDVGVPRTTFLAREFWVWNVAYRDWMARRQIAAPARHPHFRIAGPLMCGDPSWLERDARLAKQRLGLDPDRFYVGIFDVPLLGLVHRRIYYGGPRLYPDGYHKAFYAALLDLLEREPALHVFIKLKRPPSSQWHRFPEAQLELIDERNPLVRSGRVAIVHENTDPYLPIAACDAALGMLYTSPVLAAAALGKPGAYFDPLGCARYPSEPAFTHMTISSPAALHQTVGHWLAGRSTLDAAAIERLLPIPDPDFDVRTAIGDAQREAAPERAQALAPRRAAAG